MVKGKETKGKKNVVKAVVIAALSLGIVGTAFAYFTSQAEQKNNEFNIVKSEGEIEIVEPEWDPEPGKDMVPGKIIDKDPRTVSHVDYDGWVVMRIEVPKISATLDGQNGRFDSVQLLEVDTDNFKLLATDSSDKSTVYYYGYKDIVLSEAHGKDIDSGKVVQEGEGKVYMNMTTPVFNKIKVQDFTAIADAFKGSVDVDAQIIQRVDPSTGKDFVAPAGYDANDAFGPVTNAFNTLGHFAGNSTTATQQAQPTLGN
jgi:predicted ribosomally synthesized peptide with SipW-like signal peptide